MQPNGLLLLLEEPYLGSSRSGANIRGMVLADALRHKLKIAQRYYRIREYLAARKELPVNKRAREPSLSPDEDAMVVDDAAPVCNPVKRGRFEAPRSMRDRPLRRLATSMHVHSGPKGIRLAMRQEEGTVRVVLRSTRPLQPAVRPRWRPNDTRPKFSVASLAQTDEDFRNPLSYHYALHLRLRPQEGNVRHAALLHHDNLGDIYMMPIDTADCIYWFFQDDFTVVDPLRSLSDTPPVELASFEYTPLSKPGELGIASPYQSPHHDFGGEEYDFSISFDPHAEPYPELSGAPYDVSLSIHPGLEGHVQAASSIDGIDPPHMGTWGEVPVFEDVFALAPAYGEDSSAGSSWGLAPNVLTDTTESIPTRAVGDSDHFVSHVTVSDPVEPLNVAGATPPGNATKHAQARTGIRIASSGASRVAVSPSVAAITQHRNGKGSKESQTEVAETGRTHMDEHQMSSDSPREGAGSPITHLAQGRTEAVGVHSLPEPNAAELQASPEGPLEPTEPQTQEGPQQRPSQSPVSSTMRRGFFKRTIPPGVEDNLKDTQEIQYGDGGNAFVSRWSIEDTSVPFEFPSWCWNSNAEGATSLDLPRILAHRVNRGLMVQQWDGNFGLAVPGWRAPWANSDDLKPEDQVTFFDVLQHNDDVRVDKPWIMTLRLLWPQEQSRSRGKARETLSDARTRSFVYFGDGEPCAMLGSSGTEPIAPQWGPRIPVWPQVPENDIYTFWQLRLLSMTLLKPLRDDPDYRVDSHWESIEIEMPTVPGSHRGAETILDTCATRSHFHPEVINKIARLWLKDPEIQGFDDGQKDIYVERPEDYENFDIVFKFLGSDNEVANFRCGARDFLVSPYKVDGHGYYCPFAEFEGIDHLISPYTTSTLGTNFFWCAMTRLVAPLHDGTKGGWDLTRAERPYVQLAPQRVVLDGQKMGGPRDIKIYEEYPPWFQPVKHETMHVAH